MGSRIVDEGVVPMVTESRGGAAPVFEDRGRFPSTHSCLTALTLGMRGTLDEHVPGGDFVYVLE